MLCLRLLGELCSATGAPPRSQTVPSTPMCDPQCFRLEWAAVEDGQRENLVGPKWPEERVTPARQGTVWASSHRDGSPPPGRVPAAASAAPERLAEPYTVTGHPDGSHHTSP
ncbi:hypothetical protein NDU88_004508 [Pleurodeles waltl]|uniref:Secreted protein n=1 Tax=Pleurodeles waltl TaxID=8319 RepID=A0AAV7WVV9_PLEWA|nr:hypothetical protein NDU88_004508 [Pleurodeles waltl]